MWVPSKVSCYSSCRFCLSQNCFPTSGHDVRLFVCPTSCFRCLDFSMIIWAEIPVLQFSLDDRWRLLEYLVQGRPFMFGSRICSGGVCKRHRCLTRKHHQSTPSYLSPFLMLTFCVDSVLIVFLILIHWHLRHLDIVYFLLCDHDPVGKSIRYILLEIQFLGIWIIIPPPPPATKHLSYTNLYGMSVFFGITVCKPVLTEVDLCGKPGS